MVISPTKNAFFKTFNTHIMCMLTLFTLPFYVEVGLDVHKKHIISREDDLHVTKARGIDKAEPTYNLPAEICLVSSRTIRTSRSQSRTEQSPLSKEVYVIEDDAVTALEKADNVQGTRKFNNLASL